MTKYQVMVRHKKRDEWVPCHEPYEFLSMATIAAEDVRHILGLETKVEPVEVLSKT